MATNGGAQAAGSAAAPQRIPLAQRDPNAIYQKNRYGQERVVARVADVEVDETGKEILFGEISHSDDLLLPDECEYQKWIILVRKIAYAVAVDKANPQRGRVLKGVTAEILGRIDQ
ncbi:MAG TPA: hypothetical protein VNN18_07030 [Candidatus Xenobia bacterium]|nr:hypothetical protein [Candidatus Xenobia bacterium]